jgi:hypothetical protein
MINRHLSKYLPRYALELFFFRHERKPDLRLLPFVFGKCGHVQNCHRIPKTWTHSSLQVYKKFDVRCCYIRVWNKVYLLTLVFFTHKFRSLDVVKIKTIKEKNQILPRPTPKIYTAYIPKEIVISKSRFRIEMHNSGSIARLYV